MPVVAFVVLVWNANLLAIVALLKSAKNNAPVPVCVSLPLIVGVVIVGDVENTRFVLVVPVAPEAV